MQALTAADTKVIYGYVRSIWGAGAAGNEGLHDFVQQLYKTTSLKDLDRSQIEELKAHLRQAQSTPAASVPGKKRIAKIAAICYALKWDSQAIRGWLEDRFGVRDWNKLTRGQADNAINQLTMIAKRDEQKETDGGKTSNSNQ